jgi:hypothetical protein
LFTDTNPNASMANLSAVIAWGDGSTSSGTVIGPDANGVFTVEGSHTYQTSAPSGSFPVVATIIDPSGQTATAGSSALLLNSGFVFSGALAPGGNGPNALSGHANTNRPTFSGTATPFSTIQVFARLYGVDATEPLGVAIAGATGTWSLLTGPLARGRYAVTAVVTPPGASPSGQILLQNGGPVYIQVPSHSRAPMPAPLPHLHPRLVHRQGGPTHEKRG